MTTTAKDNERTISATSTPESLGSFTITPVLGTISNAVSLTDASGNTWVYNTGDISNKLPASATNTYATITVGYSIAYDNTLTNVADVNAAWDAYWDGAGSAGLTLTVEDNSGAAYEALSEGDKAGKDKVVSGEGLRLNKGSASYTASGSVTYTISASTLKALEFTKPSSTIVPPTPDSLGTVYVTVIGLDGVAQSADTYYNINAHF